MTYYEKDKQTAVIKMYATIGWWSTSASIFTNLLEQMDAKYDNIIIRVHCYGGLVYEGNAIANVLNGLDAHITWRIEGVCMSMGTILMQECDVIEMCENGILMFHSPQGYTQGNLRDHKANIKVLGIMEKNFTKAYVRRSGQSKERISEFFDGYDHYFDAEEALELGLIDKVIKPVVKNVKKLTIQNTDGVDQEDLYNKYAAYLQPDDEEEEEEEEDTQAKQTATTQPTAQGHNNNNTNKNDKSMKELKNLLIQMFSLEGVTAESSDTAIANAIKAQMEARDNKITSLNEQIAAGVKTNAEAMISATEKATGKQFSDDDKKTLVTVAEKTGMEAFQAMLGMLSPQATGATTAAPANAGGGTPQVKSLIQPNGGGAQPTNNSRADWDYKKWMKEDPDGFEALAEADPDTFNALYFAEHKVYPEDVPKRR